MLQSLVGQAVANAQLSEHGITSEAQLARYLGAYDGELVYPAGSTWTFSRFFVQQGFDVGWRLADSAGILWRVLEEFFPPPGRRQGKKHQSAGFRLDAITETIHSFLLDAMKDDRPGFRSTPERWEEAMLAARDRV